LISGIGVSAAFVVLVVLVPLRTFVASSSSFSEAAMIALVGLNFSGGAIFSGVGSGWGFLTGLITTGSAGGGALTVTTA
jgi:hypothetical protein